MRKGTLPHVWKENQDDVPSRKEAEIRPASGVKIKQAKPATTSDALVNTLYKLGVHNAFGLVGGAIVPLCDALNRSPINVLHFRHEGGAAFAAVEAHFVSNRPTVVFATTGPGITNALTGMATAWWERAKVILVSGFTSPAQRGRWAIQETSAQTMPISGLFTSGPLFDFATILEDPAELDTLASRLAIGLQRPDGFVAHISVPIGLQSAPFSGDTFPLLSMPTVGCNPSTVKECARMLAEAPFAIWVGFGARNASSAIRELAERTGAIVMCSPRGKGVFPEDHPQFLGVTGFGGHPAVEAYMKANRPAHTLVLGTRLGEFTSSWSPELIPSNSFIHVDLNPTVFGTAYPNTKTLAVQADIGNFAESLLEYFPDMKASIPGLHTERAYPIPHERFGARKPERGIHMLRQTPLPPSQGTKATNHFTACETPSEKPSLDEPLTPRVEGPVRPQFLMQAIQRIIIDESDAVVMAESGNSFAWGNHWLRFPTPGRYRVGMGHGSMGHAAAGVIGAALARNGKAVAITGDGAMLMMSGEISTAVNYNAKAVWIVLNDAQYGMIEHGMQAQGYKPVETSIPRADFVAIARGIGAGGVRVESEAELHAALKMAMRASGPFIIDVLIDPKKPAPFMERVRGLINQGADGWKTRKQS